MKVLTKKDLDKMADRGCGAPDCDHEHDGEIFFHGRCQLPVELGGDESCYPEGRIEVSYRKDTGAILISCRKCKKPIARIKVGE